METAIVGFGYRSMITTRITYNRAFIIIYFRKKCDSRLL